MFLTVLVLIILSSWLINLGLSQCEATPDGKWGYRWLNCLDKLNELFCVHYHRLQYTSVELPPTGPAIVVSNHISGLDPFLLIASTRRPLRFLIAREEYERFGAKILFKAAGSIPVDRHSRPEAALRAALKALEQGEVIALYPQGKITLPDELPRKLKKGTLWLAEKANAPIYPVHLYGIKGMGYIIRSLLMRSRAKLVAYPPLINVKKDCLDTLQHLLEGRQLAQKE